MKPLLFASLAAALLALPAADAHAQYRRAGGGPGFVPLPGSGYRHFISSAAPARAPVATGAPQPSNTLGAVPVTAGNTPRAYVRPIVAPYGRIGSFAPMRGVAYAPGTFVPGASAPNASGPYYGVNGLPANAFYPTYVSFAPYADPGSQTAGTGYPVPSINYNLSGAGGPVRLVPGQAGYDPRFQGPANFAYPNFTPGRAFYGEGLSTVVYPGSITYSQNTQATLTPRGYYGNTVPVINSNPGSNFYGSPGSQVTGSYYATPTPTR
jgi:hypothetical protein